MSHPNYPVPDPAWDDAGTWHSCQQAKLELEALITEMAEIEDVTPESDRAVRDRQEFLKIWVDGAIALLGS